MTYQNVHEEAIEVEGEEAALEAVEDAIIADKKDTWQKTVRSQEQAVVEEIEIATSAASQDTCHVSVLKEATSEEEEEVTEETTEETIEVETEEVAVEATSDVTTKDGVRNHQVAGIATPTKE